MKIHREVFILKEDFKPLITHIYTEKTHPIRDVITIIGLSVLVIICFSISFTLLNL